MGDRISRLLKLCSIVLWLRQSYPDEKLVARYTRALSGELAVEEFQRSAFVVDPPKGGVKSFMASRYLDLFAGLIGDDEAHIKHSFR